jgi:hypothetical protein
VKFTCIEAALACSPASSPKVAFVETDRLIRTAPCSSPKRRLPFTTCVPRDTIANESMKWTEFGRVSVGSAEAEHLTINVVNQEPDNWRIANVEVACGIWKGDFRWRFYNGELRRFAQQVNDLYRTLTGIANLEPMEPNLTLKMTGDGKGHVIVEGKAEPEYYAGTYLVFRIALDQTELPSIVAALMAADPA